MAKQNYNKLELTWIGKGDEPKLEPRILVENPEYSYGDPASENMLIHGDNLLALKALEQDYSGKINCIFIDPPYNTGSAFTHYDDGIEHSIWLSLIKERLILLHKLLSEDGSIWITIDDNEAHYLKVLCDEIFTRQNFQGNIVWRSSDASNNDAKTFSVDHNHILVYSKQSNWLSNLLPRTDEANAHYKNPDNDPNGPWFMGNLSSPKPRPNLRYVVVSPEGFKINPPANGWRWQESTLKEMISIGNIVFSKDGKRLIKKTYLKDQKGMAPSTLWDNIDETGHNRQAKYELKKLFPDVATSDLFGTPKPERLLHRIFQIATKENDIVLDSFLGSGTTAAVAHKMGRRWIGVELGDHAITHCQPRLKAVVDGEQGGISKAVDWKGGGGFKFYTLAPSLMNQDKYGNWVISKEYNAQMLAAAMAKQEGFVYNPDEHIYWKQGRSTEKDFIFTTTQFITVELLDKIHDEMQPDESLLIACKSYQDGCANRHSNISIKKIPNMLLGRCEFGKDDYSLNIVNMPVDETLAIVDDNDEMPEATTQPAPKKTNKKKADDSQPGLF